MAEVGERNAAPPGLSHLDGRTACCSIIESARPAPSRGRNIRCIVDSTRVWPPDGSAPKAMAHGRPRRIPFRELLPEASSEYRSAIGRWLARGERLEDHKGATVGTRPWWRVIWLTGVDTISAPCPSTPRWPGAATRDRARLPFSRMSWLAGRRKGHRTGSAARLQRRPARARASPGAVPGGGAFAWVRRLSLVVERLPILARTTRNGARIHRGKTETERVDLLRRAVGKELQKRGEYRSARSSGSTPSAETAARMPGDTDPGRLARGERSADARSARCDRGRRSLRR